MCSVARYFSRFPSCRFVLALVCSTMSSARQVTSGATPGTEVSTLGGAHGVTEAAETEGRREAFTVESGTAASVVLPGVVLAMLARESLATDAEVDLGYSRSTPSNSNLAPSRLPCAAKICASNVLAGAEFSELKAAARCACSCALGYSRSWAYALARSKCARSEAPFSCNAFSSVCAAAPA